METKSTSELLKEAFGSAIAYLPNLLRALEKVSDFFRTGSEGDAIQLFMQAENGLNWIMQLISNSIELVAEHKMDTEAKYKQYETILKETLEAWETEDYVTVADVLEYELIPLLEEWNHFMISWSESVST